MLINYGYQSNDSQEVLHRRQVKGGVGARASLAHLTPLVGVAQVEPERTVITHELRSLT